MPGGGRMGGGAPCLKPIGKVPADAAATSPYPQVKAPLTFECKQSGQYSDKIDHFLCI
jgi:hypothetical protein